MLTAKENMREVIRGGNPERYVNQYEAVRLLFHPFMFKSPSPKQGEGEVVNLWGITNVWPAGTPGQFPVHTGDKIVVKDIENWRDYVKAPSLDFSDEDWAAAKAMYDAVDGTQAYKSALVVSGLFEMTHHLCEITNALVYYLTNPDEMHELIDYLTEFELKLAEGICEHLKPDCVFHHDDWGSELSTFLRPEMFAEFFVEPYKKIYKYYHDHGCELVIHHCDSYAATLVPYMIEMGIDVWQGPMVSNNIPELIKEYGGKISFMGGIDNKLVDYEGWTPEDIYKVARTTVDECGKEYFIPCITQGGPGSTMPGTYTALTDAIDKCSIEDFGRKPEELTRILPLQILF